MRRTVNSIIMMTLSVCPLLAQERGADLFSALDFVKTESALDFVTESIKPLDLVGTSGSALDVVTSASSPLDFVGGSALDMILAGNESVNPQDALSVITAAYGGTGFYKSGVYDSGGNRRFVATSTVLPPMSGVPYYNPAWGRVTSGFGYRAQFKRMHKGIDIAMATGDTVRVALPGVVEKVTVEPRGYGQYIVVRHDDGVETRYAHLSRPLVVVGERVESMQPIALSGNSGNSTGPHLHFEARYNGEAIDPAAMFDFSGDAKAMAYSAMRGNAASYGVASGMVSGVSGKVIPASRSTYIVREGDTPKSIAARAGISVLRLCQLNFITEDGPLQTGTMLKLR